MREYDVGIIGAGPSGIFAALQLVWERPNLSIALIDSGPDLPDRDPVNPHHRLYGFSGAGAFSDGKLTLSDKVGGDLAALTPNLPELVELVDSFFLKHGAPDDISGDSDKMADLQRRSAPFGLNLISFPLRHIGTDLVPTVMLSIREYLLAHGRVDLRCNCTVEEVCATSSGFYLRGPDISCGKVMVGVGRGGNGWLERGLPSEIGWTPSYVDIGVRLETPKIILEPITSVTHDPKFVYYSTTDDRVRTFCVNPGGWVSLELNRSDGGEFYTINGHSNKRTKTEMTNLALLTSVSFTEPFNNPFEFGHHVASLSNLLGGKALVQRITDLKRGRRSTRERVSRSIYQPTLREATPGDISFALPYRQLLGILEMVDALDRLAPGVVSDNSYLYATEIKFYGHRFKVSNSMESEVPGLYIIGDCSGYTRGIMQSCVSGILAARGVLGDDSSKDQRRDSNPSPVT